MTHCDWTGLSWAAFLIPMGAFFCYVSVLAWRDPGSRLVQSTFAEPYPTQDDADQISRLFGRTPKNVRGTNLRVMKFAGPAIGAVLLVAGIRTLAAYLACRGFHLP